MHPDGPPAPHAPRDPNRIENALHPDGPPAPHAPRDPNRIDQRLNPDGPPAPRDPNRIDNALHPDGPPAPHDPNRIDNRLNPERTTPPRDPREDYMQRPPRDPREDFMQRPETPRDPRETFRQDPPGDAPPGAATTARRTALLTATAPRSTTATSRARSTTATSRRHTTTATSTTQQHDGNQSAPQHDANQPAAHNPPEQPPAGGSAGNDANADYPVREPEQNEFVLNEEPKAELAYREIRAATDDVPKVADEIGVDPDIVDVAKKNLFVNKHDVAVGPGDIRHGNFTASSSYSDLWKAVMDGKQLTPDQTNQLRSLVAHEYVEAKLMESGIPYQHANPKAWDPEDGYLFNRDHAGAHQLSPRSMQSNAQADLLRHWRTLGLTPPPGGLAADLSNIDEIVRIAREGFDDDRHRGGGADGRSAPGRCLRRGRGLRAAAVAFPADPRVPSAYGVVGAGPGRRGGLAVRRPGRRTGPGVAGRPGARREAPAGHVVGESFPVPPKMAVAIVRWAGLGDLPRQRFPELEDPYEPLVALFERGGAYTEGGRQIELGYGTYPLRSLADRAALEPAPIDAAALNALDEES